MPSLLDDPDATGNTQDLEMSGSQGSIKREGSRSVEGPKRLRRTASRTKQREGGASGLASELTQTKGDDKEVEQKSLSKIMLKATLKLCRGPKDDGDQKQSPRCARWSDTAHLAWTDIG